MSKSYS